MKNSLESLTYDEQVEAVLFGLEAERSDYWMGLRTRVERTGGRDAQLNGLYEDSNNRMNDLLDRYAGLLMLSDAMENVVPLGAGGGA